MFGETHLLLELRMNPFLQKQPLTQSVVQTLEPGLSPQRAGHLLPQYMYCSLGSLHSDDPAENIKKKNVWNIN